MSEKKKKFKDYIQPTILMFALVVLPAISFWYLQNGLSYFKDRIDEMGDFGQAPAFELINHEGDTVSLDNFKGRMQVVGYFSSDCGALCDTLVNTYSRIQKEFPNNNYMVNIYSYNSGKAAIDAVNNKEAGSKWYWLEGEQNSLDKMFAEGYNMEVQNGYSTQIALVDSSMTIRRLYDALDVDDVNRLIVHLAMAAPRPPKSAIKFKREKEK